MKSKIYILLFACLVFGTGLIVVLPGPANNRNTTRAAKLNASNPQFVAAYGKLPLAFERNQGQTESQVKFLSRGSGYTLFLTGTEAVLALNKPSAPRLAIREPRLEEAGAQYSPFNLAPFAAFLNPTAAEFKPGRGLPSQARSPDLESLTPAVLRVKLVGANPNAEVSGVEELPGKSNYFLGNDPKQWRTNVPNYAKVQYRVVYPGVDLVYYGNQAQIENDFVVAPGADPKAIQLAFESLEGTGQAAPLRVDGNGDLVLATDAGELYFHKPMVYQSVGAGVSPTGLGGASSARTHDRHLLEGHYVLLASNRVGFEVGSYDRTQPLIIDPVLSYSTYLGGKEVDAGLRIAVDKDGNAYVTGFTASTNFPTTTGALPPHLSGSDCRSGIGYINMPCPDAFVTKLNAAGSAMVYSTYLGGSRSDVGTGISVDSSGNAYVTGSTSSSDFPITAGAFQTVRKGDGDIFVTKLDATGALGFSTYIGGSREDVPMGSAVDSSGNTYVAGTTISPDFPTTPGAFQRARASARCDFMGSNYPCTDAFVAKLNATGTGLVYATSVGGSNFDFGLGIAVDGSNNAYVAGATLSPDFPTASPLQGFKGGTCGPPAHPHPCIDAFLAKVNATGAGLAYSTFLGGMGDDVAFGVAVDSSGSAYVTGITDSTDFPTTPGSAQPTLSSGTCGAAPNTFTCPDAFLAKLNATGSDLAYAAYLGGSSYELAWGIAVDGSGNAYVVGGTGSNDFPSANPVQMYFGGGNCDFARNGVLYSVACPNAFISGFKPDGSARTFSTYLGGAGGDIGFGVASDASGNVYLVGTTVSANFPTVTPLQVGLAGKSDAFVAKISFATTGPTVILAPTNVSFADQPVGLTSAVQTVTLTNSGDARLEITKIETSGDFAQSNYCGGSLSASTNCGISVTFKPTAAGGRSGSLIVTDNAAGSPHTVPLSGNGTDFSIAPSSGSSSTATITAGQSADYKLTIAPSGLKGSVSFGCSGAPHAATCTVSPTSATLDGATPAEVTATATTTARSLAAPSGPVRPPGLGGRLAAPWLLWLLAMATLAAAGVAVRKRAAWGFAITMLCVFLWVACGGGGGSPSPPPTQNGTPAGTYDLTVSGTFTTSTGTLSRSTVLTLKVQ
jgi:hypothetical protein